MEPQVLVIIGAIAIAILSVLIYGVIAVLYPEWVGITGKTALDAEKSHQEGSEAPTHFADRL